MLVFMNSKCSVVLYVDSDITLSAEDKILFSLVLVTLYLLLSTNSPFVIFSFRNEIL